MESHFGENNKVLSLYTSIIDNNDFMYATSHVAKSNVNVELKEIVCYDLLKRFTMHFVLNSANMDIRGYKKICDMRPEKTDLYCN